MRLAASVLVALGGLSAAFYAASKGSDTAPLLVGAGAFFAAGMVGRRWLTFLIPVVVAVGWPVLIVVAGLAMGDLNVPGPQCSHGICTPAQSALVVLAFGLAFAVPATGCVALGAPLGRRLERHR